MQRPATSAPAGSAGDVSRETSGAGTAGAADTDGHGFEQLPEDEEPLEEPIDLPQVPWSAIADEFIDHWGYREGYFDPEHLEIMGPSGSGKTYFEATVLQERVRRRNSAVIFIATKPIDATILRLGWPIVSTWQEVIKRKNRQCIFWPRTDKLGEEREAYLEAKISDLLERIWKNKIKVIVVFDEIATSEGLSLRLRKLIKMYWREARSVGITILAMKQRPQGIQRDMHSETSWVAAFKPKDEEDGARVAEVMGGRRFWLPILMSLDRDRHQFVLLHSVSGDAVITWVDVPLQPVAPERHGIYKGG